MNLFSCGQPQNRCITVLKVDSSATISFPSYPSPTGEASRAKIMGSLIDRGETMGLGWDRPLPTRDGRIAGDGDSADSEDVTVRCQALNQLI
jgi:hypothetical protein